MGDDRQKPFLHRIIEILTGSVIIGEQDPREWECDTLLVRMADGQQIYLGPATISYQPEPDETAHAEVLDRNPPPAIRVTELRAVHAMSGGDGTRDGLILRGFDSSGAAYEWRINGAAEASFSGLVDFEWNSFKH